MMPREELIERMAAAMYEENFTHDWKWCGSFRGAFIGKAETALNALLESLPKPVDGYQNKHDMYYRQLLEMRE